MYKVSVFILFLLISVPMQLNAAITGPLEAAYREQYEQYKNEIEFLQGTISEYQTCLTDFDDVGKEYLVLNDRVSSRRIARKEALAENVRLSKINLAVLDQCMSTFNRARGEQRSDISIDDVKNDMEYSRRRERELTAKKQELKIKILEADGELPVWWLK